MLHTDVAVAPLVESYDVLTDVDVALPAWEELALRSGAPPFAHPGWTLAWMRAFGSRGALELHTLSSGDQMSAAIPMVRRLGHLRTPTNWHTPLFAVAAESRYALDGLLGSVFDSSAAAVSMSFLDAALPDARMAADGARSAGRRLIARDLVRAPYVPLEGTFELYEAGLSRNRRKGLGRRRRQLEEHGNVEFSVWSGGPDLAERLAEVYEVEASGWKGDHGTAISSSPVTASFYSEIAAWAAARGWLRLSFVRVDGRPVAVDYALVHGGSWYSMKTGYDEEFRAFGPGVLLLHLLIEQAYADGLQRFELLGDADPFKCEWAPASRELMELRAFSPSIAGYGAYLTDSACDAARPVVRRARETVYRRGAAAGVALPPEMVAAGPLAGL